MWKFDAQLDFNHFVKGYFEKYQNVGNMICTSSPQICGDQEFSGFRSPKNDFRDLRAFRF